MEQLSREQQLANINLAEELWKERVPEDKVYPTLSAWFDEPGSPEDCGTAACFGGWCTRWPEFREQGLKRVQEHQEGTFAGAWNEYAPALPDGSWGWLAAKALFGDSSLFEPRGGHPADPSFLGDEDDETLSDYDLVLNRLAHARLALSEGGAA